MSYDIYLADEDCTCISSQRIQEGGTQLVGGTTECHLNITYNYSTLYRLTLDKEKGLRWLHGKTGRDTIGRLENAVELLGTHQYERNVDNCDKCGFTCGYGEGLSDPMLPENRRSDYWAPTAGNAGYALNILLGWAREHPNGKWWGD